MQGHRRRWPCALLLAGFVASLPAQAETAEVEAVRYRSEWRRFGTADYVGTGALGLAILTNELVKSGPEGADWTSPVPYVDRPVRDALVASSRESRTQSAIVSNWLWYASVAYPVVDVVGTPLARGGDPLPVWQMTMMNVQAFATVTLLVRVPQKWVGRTRPTVIGCDRDPEYSSQCDEPVRFVSFPGGHYAVSMAGAGLSCAHHVHGELYGGALADALACGGALGAATMVGYLRLRADEHWLSDQLVGGVMGIVSGYALPTLLYYRPFWRDRADPPRKGADFRGGDLQWTLAPNLTPDSLSVSLVLFDGG